MGNLLIDLLQKAYIITVSLTNRIEKKGQFLEVAIFFHDLLFNAFLNMTSWIYMKFPKYKSLEFKYIVIKSVLIKIFQA